MSQQSLGEKLKELRESKGLSRDQLYSQTKILVKYIEALEEGRWDLLPGKAYLKPFVKNLAEAMNADFNELYELIETQETKQPDSQPDQGKKGFDYRWLAVVLMIGLVAIIIYVLKPLSNDGDAEELALDQIPVVQPDNNHAILERDYSSNIDVSGKLLEGRTLHRLELTATDSVWAMVITDTDTVYSGLLVAGRRIVRESIEPFILQMGKSNCMDVRYNGIKLDRNGLLKNRRRIDFGQIDLTPGARSGGSGEGL